MGDSATAVAPQHLRALEHANRVRLARADLKRRIGAGSTTVAAIVADPPAEASGMTISDLLMSQRRWGRARCRRLLLTLGVPENKQIGTFTDRQRLLVAGKLAGKESPCEGQEPLPSPRADQRELAPAVA